MGVQLASVKSKLLKVFKSPFLWAFLIGVVSLHLVREFSYMRRYAPPAMVQVGEWSLTNHKGEAFGSKQLAGKVVIANFFFTHCPTICPKLIQDMKELKKRFTNLEDQVYFVSFSVDPENDTPDVLSAYAEKNDIRDANWIFLTGENKHVHHVIVDQMKLHVGEREPIPNDSDKEAELYQVSHLAEFALYDQKGDLRGKFPTDPTGLAAMERAAKFLLEKGP